MDDFVVIDVDKHTSKIKMISSKTIDELNKEKLLTKKPWKKKR